MAPARKRTKQKSNLTRTIESDVREDKKARNLLSIDLKKPSKKVKPPRIGKTTAKKQRVYTEKELGIPQLNKSINPEGIKLAKRGKKGKVFVDDNKMLQIVKSVNLHLDSRNASRLEKARQLEEIREAKRQEIERKEQEKQEKLTKKKSEIKRQKRGKKLPPSSSSERSQDLSTEQPSSASKKKKKQVGFA